MKVLISRLHKLCIIAAVGVQFINSTSRHLSCCACSHALFCILPVLRGFALLYKFYVLFYLVLRVTVRTVYTHKQQTLLVRYLLE